MSFRKTSRCLRRIPFALLFVIISLFAVLGLFVFGLSSLDPTPELLIKNESLELIGIQDSGNRTVTELSEANGGKNESLEFFGNQDSGNRTLIELGEANGGKNESSEFFGSQDSGKKCATVEEMGEIFRRGYMEETIRVRKRIHAHFTVNGASRVRELPPEQFCSHGFVLGKASEAGLGNEMYKILTAAALSVMLKRSLIIGQTRGAYPFGDYISYSNVSFTLKEVKHLWRKNRCLVKYGRHLTMRIDDFQQRRRTDVLCGNWREWEQPIIWFQNTTNAVAAQFFLKNVHSQMREAASDLFGRPKDLQYRANVFGELMKILVTPSREIDSAVSWALNGKEDPDIALHLRMMMNRSPNAKQAALNCVSKAIRNLQLASKPKVVLVSDTPAMLRELAPSLNDIAEVVYFDYEGYDGNISGNTNKTNGLNFRARDWGPAPRWVAFVDFFLASRAKHAIVSGAQRRVGTTYVQLIAALAAANRLDENESISNNTAITFLSSFQSNLVSDGLSKQIGWGHVWNRFSGPLSCHGQPHQCALTPLLPPAWWDGLWQSPIPRDVKKIEAYGIRLLGFDSFDESNLIDFCSSRRHRLVTVQLI